MVEALGARPETAIDPASEALDQAVTALRSLMWKRAGLIRDAEGLRLALDGLNELEPDILSARPSRPSGEARNLLTVARLIAAAALARRESRGSHFRADFPEADPRQARRMSIQSGSSRHTPSALPHSRPEPACPPSADRSPRSRPSTACSTKGSSAGP
jgi:aspartate oxidase